MEEKTNMQKLIEITAKLNKNGIDVDNFFDTNTLLLAETNLDGYFTRVSRGWTEVFGFSSEEVAQHPWLFFVHPDDVQPTLDIFTGMKNGVSVEQFINRYRCKDGSYRRLMWRASGYDEIEKAKKTGKLFCSAVDITGL